MIFILKILVFLCFLIAFIQCKRNEIQDKNEMNGYFVKSTGTILLYNLVNLFSIFFLNFLLNLL